MRSKSDLPLFAQAMKHSPEIPSLQHMIIQPIYSDSGSQQILFEVLKLSIIEDRLGRLQCCCPKMVDCNRLPFQHHCLLAPSTSPKPMYMLPLFVHPIV